MIFYSDYYPLLITALCASTEKTEVNLTSLQPCESYLIAVAIMGPNESGPLPTHNPIVLETTYDERKPPKNVQVSMNSHSHELELLWEHNCALNGQYPPSYVITLHELTKNETSVVEVKRRSSNVLKHTFVDIPRGAVFNVTVASNKPGAKGQTVKVYAAPLPSVRQLKVYPEKNGTYVVYWHEIEDDAGP